MTPLTLTLDIGTSSTRALLWDTQGREIEEVRAQIPYEMHLTADGGVEMPAEKLLAHVGDCLDAALAQAGYRAQSIQAVGISTFWHSLLGLDGEGKPLTPLYSWADNRSGPVARRLRAAIDNEALRRRTGCVIHPSYYPAKLVWLRETQPETFDRVAHWVSPSEYLFSRWFGMEALSVSISMASGTGLFHQEHCVWDEETLELFALPLETLSPIVDLSQSSRGLHGAFADRWPALRDVPFFPAVGDGACGNVGSGCLSPERFAINLGTSGAIRALWREDRGTANGNPVQAPRGLWRYRVDARRPAMGAAFSDGGNVYAWLTHTLQLPSHDALEHLLAESEPGAHGLTFLPFLAGERSLGWNPDARATLSGMNLDTSPEEIFQAAMEAVALRFALAARRLREVFPQSQEIIASGGAFGQSPALARMFANALGQPVTLTEEPEASSRGAALLAMEAAGLLAGLENAPPRLGRTFTPDAGRHARYVELLEQQQQLYTRLIGT